jgi:hypothetical protein
MGAVFQRRFTSNPGQTVLLNIEAVDVIDLVPTGAIIGVGSGLACIVGEFEDGPFNYPTQLFSAPGLVQQFGQLGFMYGGSTAANPCARQRFADGALVPEYWNGNGFVQLNAKQFSGLVVCRVNTSVGAVSVARLAYLTGAAQFNYALANAQVLQLDVGAGPVSATFTAAAATVAASGGTYPSTFTGGQTLVLGYDGAPNFTTTFLSTDQTVAQVAARINQYAGFTFATVVSSQLTLTGLQQGLGGQVRVVSGSSGVLTQLGLTAGTTLGTGNVQNILQVMPTEIAAIVQGAISGTAVAVDQNGALRIANTGASGYILVGSGTTATALGFLPGTQATSNGQPILVSGSGTYALGTTGTIVFQLGAALAQVTATVTATNTLAQTVTALNAAFTAAGQGAPVTADGTTRFYIAGALAGDTISVVSASASAVLTELGLTVGNTTGVLVPYGLLPAGTQVGVSGGAQYVTMQDLDFEQAGVYLNSGGPNGNPQVLLAPATSYSVPVRPAVDDGSGVSATAGTVVTFAYPPLIGAFSVTNPQVVNAALTESQIDAAYATALNSTQNINGVARQINIIWAARQSNAVRSALRLNALNASANGCYGRVACIRTPLNTLESVALSTSGQPGVGAYRDQRVVYCYPQANTFVPQIAAVGTAGGTGFNATGNVDVGADGFLASVLSQLAPEEDPGQLTSFLDGVNSLESGANIQLANGGTGFQINDYIAFKAAGICALRWDQDDGTAVFQSGVTSANQQTQVQDTDINTRRMADYIEDSESIALTAFGKQLSKVKRRNAIAGEIQNFLTALAGGGAGAKDGTPNDEDDQRIAGFSIDTTTGNTEESLGLGIYVIIQTIQTLSSLKAIVLQTTIGPTAVTTVQQT